MWHWWQFDHIIVEFAQGNTITLSILYAALKGVAYMHKGVKSNSIWELGALVVNSIRSGTPITNNLVAEAEKNS